MKNIALKDRGANHTQEEDKDKIYSRLKTHTLKIGMLILT